MPRCVGKVSEAVVLGASGKSLVTLCVTLCDAVDSRATRGRLARLCAETLKNSRGKPKTRAGSSKKRVSNALSPG